MPHSLKSKKKTVITGTSTTAFERGELFTDKTTKAELVRIAKYTTRLLMRTITVVYENDPALARELLARTGFREKDVLFWRNRKGYNCDILRWPWQPQPLTPE